ncbi:MAG: hypothetical protein ACAH59_06315 [Pseudobdellovibrionaceae bacterium]
MKMMLTLSLGLMAMALNSQATEIRGARLDATGKNVLIDVSYGGGCENHEFSLKLKGCFESYPVQCQADLVHLTEDHCEAYISETISINLAQSGIQGGYYFNGSLTIQSPEGAPGKNKATVDLPAMNSTAN